MANEQLRAALARAGLDPDELADQLRVDAKTAERWLGGRVPHARHRARIAHALDTPEPDLWPHVTDPTEAPDDRRELTGLYAHADDPRAPDWQTLLPTAHEQIDLLDPTLHDILTTPGTIDLLADKASAGCEIRILIAHPKSIWVTSLAQQLGHTQTDTDGNTHLDREINQSLHHLHHLADHDHIDLRTFWAERTLSILRFDDQMLVTPHLHGLPGARAPLLHLHRRDDDGPFDRFADHLNTMHHHASDPIPADLNPGPAPTAPGQKPAPGATP